MNVIMLLKTKDTVSYLYDTDTFQQGLKELHDGGYTAIPVLTTSGTYAGCVSEGDFLRFLLKHPDGKVPAHTIIRDLIRPGFAPAVRIDVDMDQLLHMSLQQNFIPVTDDRDYFIGIVTRQDIIRSFIHETAVKNIKIAEKMQKTQPDRIS